MQKSHPTRHPHPASEFGRAPCPPPHSQRPCCAEAAPALGHLSCLSKLLLPSLLPAPDSEGVKGWVGDGFSLALRRVSWWVSSAFLSPYLSSGLILSPAASHSSDGHVALSEKLPPVKVTFKYICKLEGAPEPISRVRTLQDLSENSFLPRGGKQKFGCLGQPEWSSKRSSLEFNSKGSAGDAPSDLWPSLSTGMMLGGGCGKELAHWIVHGHPEMDMFSYDIR